MLILHVLGPVTVFQRQSLHLTANQVLLIRQVEAVIFHAQPERHRSATHSQHGTVGSHKLIGIFTLVHQPHLTVGHGQHRFQVLKRTHEVTVFHVGIQDEARLQRHLRHGHCHVTLHRLEDSLKVERHHRVVQLLTHRRVLTQQLIRLFTVHVGSHPEHRIGREHLQIRAVQFAAHLRLLLQQVLELALQQRLHFHHGPSRLEIERRKYL